MFIVTHSHCGRALCSGAARVHVHPFFFRLMNSVLAKNPLEKDKKRRHFQGLDGHWPFSVRSGSSDRFFLKKYLVEQCNTVFVPRWGQKPRLHVRGFPVITQLFYYFFRLNTVGASRNALSVSASTRVSDGACAYSCVIKWPTGV